MTAPPDVHAHYENFPVASWLCPPRLRPAIAAIYGFARTADDIADEGDATADERLAQLAAFRAELRAVAAGAPPSPRWPGIFGPLAVQLHAWRLPLQLLEDLLDAFEQDIRMTRDQARYPDRTALLDYCRRSANPVGRLLLHLYGIDDAASLARSDAICTGLQLANFWQDPSVDIPRGRHYFTDADLQRFGIARAELATGRDTAATRALVADNVAWARACLNEGAPLALRIPGRAGWELRLVVQGGQRILDRIAALDHGTLSRRPKLGASDLPVMLWRALRMKPAANGTIRADT
ncbi:squalene synthase HpnC [Xylophilus rhododendri]|nr:squalene synthase HpnC [Xylophilus rhododendri]